MMRLLPLAAMAVVLSWTAPATANRPIRLGGLIISDTTAHDFDCLFGDQCQTARAAKQVSTITLPAGVTGTATFETNTVLGSGSVPGSGKTGYAYRVDMSKAVSGEEVACVTDVTVELGPITQLKYDGNLLADVFVVTQGGLGTVNIYSAVTTGNLTTFTFDRPLCAGDGTNPGLASFYFGVASIHPPKPVSVNLGWPGLVPISVDARAPGH